MACRRKPRTSITSPWYEHAQRLRPNFVVKRRIHDVYFSICGYVDARGSGLDPYFFRFEGIELSIGIASQEDP